MIDELKRIAEQLEGTGIVKMVEMQKLTLEPNEYLIVRFNGKVSPAQMRKYATHLAGILGKDANRVLMTGDGVQFAKVQLNDAPGGKSDGST